MEEIGSQQQELPEWQSERPTYAGPASPPVASNEDLKKPRGCCSNCINKLGPLSWYFYPLFGNLGYSLSTAFYHPVAFIWTLATFIIVVTILSVSIGLLILVFGFILYWWSCEISVLLAKIDLALAYYMVEDNYELIEHRRHTLQLLLYKNIAPCPCSQRIQSQGVSCMSALGSRMKSLMLRCDMYKIIFFQIFFKPLIVGLTWWIFIVVVYIIATIFAPLVYIIDNRVFTQHYWCPFNRSSCNDDDDCECAWISIETFWGALLCGIISFLLLPLCFRVSIWFAKASKVISYYFLTNYYNKGNKAENEKDNLIRNSRNSNKNNNNAVTQDGIVHSINNPYDEAQV